MFPARPLSGKELEELPWRWEAGRGGGGLRAGHPGPNSLRMSEMYQQAGACGARPGQKSR